MRGLIGDRLHFGIEYQMDSNVRPIIGKIRLWLEGRSVGYFDGRTHLSSTVFQLEDVDFDHIEGCQFSGMSANQVYDLIESGSVANSRRYLIILGDSFDDFLIYRYVCGDSIYFVWRLVDRPCLNYPGYPVGVQCARVLYCDFQKVVAEFRELLLVG